MRGYVVTWCETDRDGKRVKKREEFTVDRYTYPGNALVWAQERAGQLRSLNYAACVEPLQ